MDNKEECKAIFMTKNKTYALAIDRIESAVEDFKSGNGNIQVTEKKLNEDYLLALARMEIREIFIVTIQKDWFLSILMAKIV